MITDQAGYEDALEEISRYLDQPPQAGSPEDAEFASLLAAIAQYQPTVSSPRSESALTRISQRAQALVQDADRLQHLVQTHMATHFLTIPGDRLGMGPTTGASREV